MMKFPLGFSVSSISCFFDSIFVFSFLLHTLVSLPLPRPDQVDMLLDFKNEFPSTCNFTLSGMPQATKSWTKDTIDFDGVVFDNETGVVTELNLYGECLSGSLKANSSLFKFQHLRYLDLSDNDFASSLFLVEFGRLTNLEHLALRGNGLVGEVPSSISNLNRLTYLDLSNNEFTDGFPFIYNITELSFIDLSWNHFYGTIPSSLFTMPFLSSLYLHENHLKDPLKTMNSSSPSKLKYLSLVKNLLGGGILEPISKLDGLTHLHLSFNDFFSSQFPSEFGKLANLESLDLQSNGFIGGVPSSISNLSHLIDLDLSYNKFTGPIPSSLLTTSSSLSYLDLSGNHLNDPLQYMNSSSSSSSKFLELHLGNNLFSDKILEPILKLVNLMDLDLSFLNITYPINFSFLPLKSLKVLDISGNNITWFGSIPDDALSTRFTRLRLSSCNINKFPEFLKKQHNIEWLDISNNNINDFPTFLKKNRNLQRLDISNNNIKGEVPGWLWNLPSLIDVLLSNNSFNSFQGSPEALLNSSVQSFELDSNAFQGSFPILPPSMTYLSARNNNFSGDIPLSLCNMTLSVLYLSNNNFSGPVPPCFKETLEELDLHNNSLNGKLSDSFKRRYPILTILDVRHNQITGKLPRSLVNCTSLEVLNVGSNGFIDTFPFWLKTLPNLQVIILRSNGFHGPISSRQDPLSFLSLRMMDISHNNFTGMLPRDYFVNWSAALVNMPEVYRLPEYMRSVYKESYQPSIYLTKKGLTMELEKILVTSTIIDFSRNKFGGQIPETIGLLKQLVVLDLSNNDFVGNIPSSLAKLTKLESLDLSGNQLTGEIPQELTILTFLGYIDVSQNKLSGQIPQSTQFGGQPKSSFESNIDLCGPPLQKSCFEEHVSPTLQSKSPEQEHLLNWKAATIGYGPGILIGLAIGHVLASHRPALYYKLFRLNLSGSICFGL